MKSKDEGKGWRVSMKSKDGELWKIRMKLKDEE